ncbi:hypothetical protein [Streptomyces sp. TR06-5]|uniref:hypothetical protein n=1 Tax=unclassified Streptomyces TaxID=2593676 RepID=UPI0039A00BAB
MSEGDQFDGLAEHVVSHVGPAVKRWTPTEDDAGYGVTLHYPEERPLPVVSAVTNGLRYRPVRSPEPVELICTLQTGQEPAALHLVHTAARYLLRDAEPKPLAVQDQLIASDDLLVPRTQIRGLLFGVHPVFRGVSSFAGKGGATVLRYLTLLPLTASDIRFLTQGDEGPGRQERLWQRWRADRVEFWDVERSG